MGKVWLVTGAGSGLGTGIAKAALQAGDSVVATGRSLDKLRHALNAEDTGNLALVPLDVSDEGQAQSAVLEAVQRFGRLDVLVNNAGYSLLGNFEEMTVQEIERIFATNFYGVVNVMRATLPVMRRQRSGHVINLSSLAGVIGFKHCAAYSATKFAVEGLSASVAAEVEQFGIRVSVIEPGFFRTDLLDSKNAQWASQAIEDYAGEPRAEEQWSPYHGTQQGDPVMLGQVLVKLTRMEHPPRQFHAGSDALAAATANLEARLKEICAFADLSKSTDGTF
jgi:NAD(P)-dependent dehydrogenase (short-subunit alcohol dehydrogenase family)